MATLDELYGSIDRSFHKVMLNLVAPGSAPIGVTDGVRKVPLIHRDYVRVFTEILPGNQEAFDKACGWYDSINQTKNQITWFITGMVTTVPDVATLIKVMPTAIHPEIVSNYKSTDIALFADESWSTETINTYREDHKSDYEAVAQLMMLKLLLPG